MQNPSETTPKNNLILVVEDDSEIANFIVSALHKAGFRVALAHNSRETFKQFREDIPDLVVLDVMLPGDDGFHILGSIRKQFDTPVIMLTALTELKNRIKGLASGADDYISKPFHTSELIARIFAVLRRRSREVPAKRQPTTIGFDEWRMDQRNRTVQDPSGTTILLTSGEFDILWALCARAGDVLSRDALVQASQNRAVEPYDRRVDTLVSRIRRKLRNPDMIKTVRNGGYVFTPKTVDLDP